MSTMSFQEFKRFKYDEIQRMFEVEEILVQKRGHDAFVVLNIEHYERLRMYELKSIITEAKKDMKDGKYKIIDDVKKYTEKLEEKIKKVINNDKI